jgi:hypothetical protein
MVFRITAKQAAPKFKQNLAGLGDRMEAAFSAAMNMAASLIKTQSDADIQAAGKFGERWTQALHVDVNGSLNNMRISVTNDIPYAGIFETGGVIHGHPLLWIGLTGTDAEGVEAKDYPGLYSGKGKGRPLLFSISDKKPKYFGIESVTIPQKFHTGTIVKSVMANFRSIFDDAFRGK